MALNNKQTVFVEEYLRCWNASEAARRAGYNGQANIVGPRLLSNVIIKAQIDARIAELKMSTNEVLIRLAEQARGSHADFSEVNLREDLKDHPKAHLVKSIVADVHEDSQGRVHHKLRIELYDAQAALVHIGKAHGLFTDKLKIEDDTLTDEDRVTRIASLLDRARARRDRQADSGTSE